MAAGSTIVKWKDQVFSVKPRDVVGVKDITASGTCETKEAKSGKQRYVKHKARKPIEFTMTAQLNSYLTKDVQQRALELVKISTRGKRGYIYMGAGKLYPCQFMLTSAKVSKVSIAAGVQWVSCEVALSFKQASKYDGSVSAGKKSSKKKSKSRGRSGGSSKKGSAKKKNWLTEAGKKIASGVTAVTKLVGSAAKQTKNAKKQSRATYFKKKYANKTGATAPKVVALTR